MALLVGCASIEIRIEHISLDGIQLLTSTTACSHIHHNMRSILTTNLCYLCNTGPHLSYYVRSKRVRLTIAGTVGFLLLFFFIPPHVVNRLQRNLQCSDSSTVTDWSQFAYSQYVTNPDYLCNSVMAFEALDRLGSKAARVLMYPSDWSIDRDPADHNQSVTPQSKDVVQGSLSPGPGSEGGFRGS